jgi:hypothetical protein
LSLLAPDAYNREYDENLVVEGPRIGEAEILTRQSFNLDQQVFLDWQAADFYAIAYEWNGETIFS